MRTLSCVAAMIFLGLCGVEPCAQQRAASPAPETAAIQAGGRIAGIVLCADTRKPARGAQVRIVETSPTSRNAADLVSGSGTITGLDGSFVFDHVAPGSYLLWATMEGYRPTTPSPPGYLFHATQLPAEWKDDVVPIHAAETVTRDLMLVRGAVIAGRVVYSDGSPAIQAAIILNDVEAASSKRFVIRSTGDVTDDEGHFRIAGLPAGRVLVSVLPQIGRASLYTAHPFTSTVFAPSTFRRAAATIYELRAGETLDGVDITIPLSQLHDVSGRLTAHGGRQPNMGEVTLTDTSDERIKLEEILAEDGTFRFQGVPPGTYTLRSSQVFFGAHHKAERDEDENASMLTPENAFADGSLTVLVKDTDVGELIVTCVNVPMPPPRVDEVP